MRAIEHHSQGNEHWWLALATAFSWDCSEETDQAQGRCRAVLCGGEIEGQIFSSRAMTRRFGWYGST